MFDSAKPSGDWVGEGGGGGGRGGGTSSFLTFLHLVCLCHEPMGQKKKISK